MDEEMKSVIWVAYEEGFKEGVSRAKEEIIKIYNDLLIDGSLEKEDE